MNDGAGEDTPEIYKGAIEQSRLCWERGQADDVRKLIMKTS
jgi:hypothetical protein